MDWLRKTLLLTALFVLLGSIWMMDTSRAYLKTKGEFHVIHETVIPAQRAGDVKLLLARSGPGWEVLDRRIASSGKVAYSIVRDPKTGAETARFKNASPAIGGSASGGNGEFKVIVTYRVMIHDLPADAWNAGRLIFGSAADWVPPAGASQITAYSAG